MRNCLRCHTQMLEDLELKIKSSGMKIIVSEKGSLLGSHPLSDINLAICPKCGYTELYVSDPDCFNQAKEI